MHWLLLLSFLSKLSAAVEFLVKDGLQTEGCTETQVKEYIAKSEGVDPRFVSRVTLSNNFLGLNDNFVRYSSNKQYDGQDTNLQYDGGSARFVWTNTEVLDSVNSVITQKYKHFNVTNILMYGVDPNNKECGDACKRKPGGKNTVYLTFTDTKYGKAVYPTVIKVSEENLSPEFVLRFNFVKKETNTSTEIAY